MLQFIKFLQQLYTRMQENETPARTAQISYFFLLAIFPFLLVLITLIDYTPLTQKETLEQLSLLFPEVAVAVVKQIVSEVEGVNNTTLIILGILGTTGSASRGTFVLIKSINQSYNIKEDRSFVKLLATQIFAILAMVLIILFTLGFLVFGRIIGEFFFVHIGLMTVFITLWTLLRYAIPLLIILAILTLILLYSPNCRLRLKNVYLGAIVSTIGWFVASQAFAFFVNNYGSVYQVYGSIGGFIVFMIWIYISSMALLLGGEINALMYRAYQQQTT